jgi:hypothetical protein
MHQIGVNSAQTVNFLPIFFGKAGNIKRWTPGSG